MLVKDGREEVIQAWYMDDSQDDQRLPHHKDPKEFISLDKLAGLCVFINMCCSLSASYISYVMFLCRAWSP